MLRGAAAVEVLRVSLQSATFLLVGRVLGAGEFGIYAAVMAVIGFAAPFAGLGAAHRVVRDLGRAEGRAAQLVTRAMAVTGITAAVSIPICVGVAAGVLGAPLPAAFGFALAELLFAALTNVLALWAVSENAVRRYAVSALSIVAAKTAAAIALVFTHKPTLTMWSLLYLTASALSLLIAWLSSDMRLGNPRPLWKNWIWGAQVSVTQLAQGATNDLDKPFLVAQGLQEESGAYAAAYRLMSLTYFAPRAAQTTMYPRFFRAAGHGPGHVRTLLTRLLLASLAWAALCAAIGFASAPLIPQLLGASYAAGVVYFKWLLLIPPLKFSQWFIADALTGLDRQLERTALQLFSAAATVLLLVVLVPRFGVAGAIAATVVVEALHLCSLGLLFVHLSRTARGAPDVTK